MSELMEKVYQYNRKRKELEKTAANDKATIIKVAKLFNMFPSGVIKAICVTKERKQLFDELWVEIHGR